MTWRSLKKTKTLRKKKMKWTNDNSNTSILITVYYTIDLDQLSFNNIDIKSIFTIDLIYMTPVTWHRRPTAKWAV